MAITLRARAKINFCLDIIGKRDDGYHLIESLMQSVELHDSVTVRKTSSRKIQIKCSDKSIAECDNIAYKAAKCFFDNTGAEFKGVTIKIKKRIPSQAGLGGGSSDAAAVLVALNRLYKTELNETKLCELGEKVGADVPFCIVGGTQLVRGIGEQLTRLDDCRHCYIVICKGADGVSTKEAYAALDSAKDVPPVYLNKVIDAVCGGNFSDLKGKLTNVFEKTCEIPAVLEITNRLRELNAIEAAMTGSGSAVFGIYTDKKAAKLAAKTLKKEYGFAVCTSVSPIGISRF